MRVPQLVDQFVTNQNALLDFGQSAVEGINGTVNRILTEQKKLQIPQVDDLLQEDVLARNIVSAEMLIEDNTKSIENLVGVISFIEASQAEAGDRAAGLKAQVDQLDTSTVEYQTKSQELDRMAEVSIHWNNNIQSMLAAFT